MDLANRRVLILGYGNSGRQDDGLGPAAALALECLQLPQTRIMTKFSLNIEDAPLAAEHDALLLIDAAKIGPEPFAISEILPKDQMACISHALTPESLLALCQSCYGRYPRTWLLAIRGYAFDFGDELSAQAEANLQKAVEYVRTFLLDQMRNQPGPLEGSSER